MRGEVLLIDFAFMIALPAGLEKLCWGLQEPCINMASKATGGIRSSWVCCCPFIRGAPSWLCFLCGWETHGGCRVWGANHMGVIWCLPMGMLYLPNSERLTAVHGTSCPKRKIWAKAQEDVGVIICAASIRDSMSRPANVPCMKNVYIIHIRACKKTRLGQRTDSLVQESSKKAPAFGPLHFSVVKAYTEPCIPTLWLAASVVN